MTYGAFVQECNQTDYGKEVLNMWANQQLPLTSCMELLELLRGAKQMEQLKFEI